MTLSARIAGSGFLIAAILLIGCDSGNKHLPAKLTGKVTYKGAPVGGGVITLHAADGQLFMANLGRDGSFTFPALPEGTLTATVETESVNPKKTVQEYRGQGGGAGGMYGKGAGGGAMVPKGQGARIAPPPEGANVVEPVYVKIPSKYADKTKSGLSVTLKKGEQEHNFELTD